MSWAKWAGMTAVVGLAAGAAVLYVSFGAFLPWREEAEAQRLAALLKLSPGQTVADIGAGGGRFTVAFARVVGSSGRVYATELEAAKRQALADRAAAAGLSNVTVREGAPAATNLPDACCDAIVMRAVYHHLADPTSFAASSQPRAQSRRRRRHHRLRPGNAVVSPRRPRRVAAHRPRGGPARCDCRAHGRRLRCAGGGRQLEPAVVARRLRPGPVNCRERDTG
jgi:predicted methyltransferase